MGALGDVAIGASYASKRWLAERFLQLARLVDEQLEVPVILLGGPSDRESAGDELEALAAENRSGVVDFVGKTSVCCKFAVGAVVQCGERVDDTIHREFGPQRGVDVGVPVAVFYGVFP